MNARYFLDTNVFIYSFDKKSPKKRKTAKELITRALSDDAGFISFQVVQEFLNVALQKFQRPMSFEESHLYLKNVMTPLCEVYPDTRMYHSALEIKSDTRYGFYDSLVLAAAIQGGGKILYTEDLQHKFRYGGLQIINPFAS